MTLYKIDTLWSEIAEFEEGEQKLKLKPLQWEARMSARMKAYDKLQDDKLTELEGEKRFR